MTDHRFEVSCAVAVNLMENASLTFEDWPFGEVAEGDRVTLERPGCIIKATVQRVVGNPVRPMQVRLLKTG